MSKIYRNASGLNTGSSFITSKFRTIEEQKELEKKNLKKKSQHNLPTDPVAWQKKERVYSK